MLDLTELLDKIIGLPQHAVLFMQRGISKNDRVKDESINKGSKENELNKLENGTVYTNEQDNEDIETELQNCDVERAEIPTKQRVSMITEEAVIVFDGDEDNNPITIENNNENNDPIIIIENNNDSDMPNLSSDTIKSTDAIMSAIKNSHFNMRNTKLNHAFEHFAKSIQKMSTISFILLAGFLTYNIYIYTTKARRLSYDWLILFPFPFWFVTVTTVNLIMFVITEIILLYEKKKEFSLYSKQIILYEITRDFFVAMSTTTLPLFVFFHLFWLAITLTAYSTRLLSSATFYLPLVIFSYWLFSVTNGILKQWKKLIVQTMHMATSRKGVCRLIGRFLYTLAPLLFLPFWMLLLATLYFFSDFLLVVVNLEEHSFLIVAGAIIIIAIITRKVAKHCQPQLDDDDDN